MGFLPTNEIVMLVALPLVVVGGVVLAVRPVLGLYLLAGVVPELPIGVDAQLPEEPHRTLRQRFDVVREEQCWRCHKKMNPLGLPFESYDDFGRYREEFYYAQHGKLGGTHYEREQAIELLEEARRLSKAAGREGEAELQRRHLEDLRRR